MENENSVVNSVENQSVTPSSVKKPSFASFFSNKKLLIFTLIIFAVLGLLAYVLVANKDNNLEAQKAFNEGDYTKSTKLFQEAHSSKKDAQSLTGILKSIASSGNETGTEQEKLQQAQPYIEEALQKFPNDPEVLASVGYTYETAGDYEKALQHYQKALELSPKSASLTFQVGHTKEFLGRRSEAYADYNKAYTLDPNNPQVLIARGNMLLSNGMPQESYDSFKRASDLPGISNTTKAEALTGASLVRSQQDDFKYIKDATALSKKAVETSPGYAPALAAHAYNLFLTEPTTDPAIDMMKKAIEANPRLSKNYYMLGLFYRAKADYDSAFIYISQAIARVDNDNTILSTQDRTTIKGQYTYELAKASTKAKKPATETLTLLKQAVELYPSLKARLMDDAIRYELFLELQQNKEFIALVRG